MVHAALGDQIKVTLFFFFSSSSPHAQKSSFKPLNALLHCSKLSQCYLNKVEPFQSLIFPLCVSET